MIARGPVVYFVEAVGLDRIKIGFTTDLQARLGNLRTSSPVELRLLAALPASRADESALHELFERERLWPTREWFASSDRLREIAAAASLLPALSSPALVRLGLSSSLYSILDEHALDALDLLGSRVRLEKS